jgi:hypothetical protein
MDYTISSCFIQSSEHTSHPNGELTARGFVNFFDNRNSDRYNPVKLEKIDVTNSNGVSFFKRDTSISVSALRAIAASLIEIADKAEKANAHMKELNNKS